MTITDTPHVINDEGGAVAPLVTTPTATVELNLDQLRLLCKSVGKTMDAEVKKLTRLAPGSHHHSSVKADFDVIDSVDVEIRSAISQLVQSS